MLFIAMGIASNNEVSVCKSNLCEAKPQSKHNDIYSCALLSLI